MMRRLRSIAVLSVLCSALWAVSAMPAYAADILPNNVCNGDAGSSALCQNRTTENPITGPNGILLKVTQIIAVLAGIGAVIAIIVSGLQYVTSSGDPAKTQAAKNMLIYALIGLVVIALSGTLVSLVLGKL